MTHDRTTRFVLRPGGLVVAFSICVLFLSSCPQPLLRDMVLQTKDRIPPVITIVSPANGSSYAATVVVEGRATDAATATGEGGAVASLSFEVLASAIGHSVTLGDKGRFSFSFPTTGISGTIVVKISALDKNNNRAEATLTLEDAGAIPSFSAVPGNHEIVLTWDPVPLATSYTLHYTANGALPSESYGSHLLNVTSPTNLTDLPNATTYVFLLQAHSSSGEDNWSPVVRAIPLSPLSLCPVAQGDHHRIRLDWRPVVGTDTYDVLRSAARNGEYAMIMTGLAGTSYEDTAVADYQTYFYKVRPGVVGSIASAPAWAAASGFDTSVLKVVGFGFSMFQSGFRSIAVEGNYAYRLQYSGFLGPSSSMDIIDLTDPTNPTQAASVHLSSTQDPGRDVIVDSDHVFIAGPGGTAFSVIDVNDPENPGSLYGCGGVTDIQGICTKDASTVIAADGAAGIKLVDVSDPHAPEVTESYATSAYAWAAAFDGPSGCAVVADGDAGVTIVDLTTGTRHSADTPGTALEVVLKDHYALVADGTAGLSVVDIGTPTSPTLTTTIELGGDAVDIAFDGNFASVALGTGGICLVDVSDPSNPALAASDTNASDAVSLAMSGGRVFVSDDGDLTLPLKVFEISTNLPTPAVTQTLDYPTDGALDTNGKYLFAGEANSGFCVIDMANGDRVSEYVSNGTAAPYELIVRGDYAFLSYGGLTTFYLEIVDVSDPLHPQHVSTLQFPGAVLLSDVDGDYGLLTGQLGFQVLDLSRPSQPTILAAIPLSGLPYIAKGRGNYAFVACSTGGFDVVDLSIPSSPRKIGSCAIPGEARCVCVAGNNAVVGTSEGYTYVLDVENPSHPTILGSAQIPSPYRSESTGAYVYAMAVSRLSVINLSGLTVPHTVAQLQIPMFNEWDDIVVAGRYAYLNYLGLAVIDLLSGG